MTTTTKARHRKASRPVTPLTSAAPAARRGLAVAASSGLALTMIASGASAANSTEVAASAGSLEAAGTGALAADARAAITTNAAVTVASDVTVPADLTDAGEVTVQAPVVVEPETTTEATTETAEAAQDEATAEEAVADDTTQASTTTTSAAASAPAPAASGSSIVSIAMQYVGRPYVSGASGPNAFDCSGLVQYVYAQAGISLPRTSYAQGSAGTMVSAAEAQPGDIVYYGYHVGIYAGNGMMIDAGTTSTGVVYRQIWGNPIGYIRVG